MKKKILILKQRTDYRDCVCLVIILLFGLKKNALLIANSNQCSTRTEFCKPNTICSKNVSDKNVKKLSE